MLVPGLMMLQIPLAMRVSRGEPGTVVTRILIILMGIYICSIQRPTRTIIPSSPFRF